MTNNYLSYPRQSGKNMLRKALNALVAIQELHKPLYEGDDPVGCLRCDWESDGQFPCATRKLADEALGED